MGPIFFSIFNPCPNLWQVRARFLGHVHILVMNNFGSDPRLADRITNTPKLGILPDKLFYHFSIGTVDEKCLKN